MTSGIMATLSSHPLEIIRARLQTNHNILQIRGNTITQISIAQQLTDLLKKGDLFKGVAPRLVKKPLANTITFWIF